MSYLRDQLSGISQSLSDIFTHPHFPGNSGWLSGLSKLSSHSSPTQAPKESPENAWFTQSFEHGKGWVRNYVNVQPVFHNQINIEQESENDNGINAEVRIGTTSKAFGESTQEKAVSTPKSTTELTTPTTQEKSTASTAKSTTKLTMPTTQASTSASKEIQMSEAMYIRNDMEDEQNKSIYNRNRITEEAEFDTRTLVELTTMYTTTIKPQTTIQTTSPDATFVPSDPSDSLGQRGLKESAEPAKPRLTTAIRARIALSHSISADILDPAGKLSNGAKKSIGLKFNSNSRYYIYFMP